MADHRGRVWNKVTRRWVRVESPEDELARLIKQQATDMAGNRDYWPSSGRHTRAASLDEMVATQRVDEWEDPVAEAVLGDA